MNLRTGLRPNEGRSFLKDDRGAIDLPSTMVTVVIVAILFAAVALTVFKIIPWAQDTMNKHNVETVAAALDQYRTQVESGIISGAQVQSPGFAYADTEGLVSSGVLAKVPEGVRIELHSGGAAFGEHSNDTTGDDAYRVSVELNSGQIYELFGGWDFYIL